MLCLRIVVTFSHHQRHNMDDSEVLEDCFQGCTRFMTAMASACTIDFQTTCVGAGVDGVDMELAADADQEKNFYINNVSLKSGFEEAQAAKSRLVAKVVEEVQAAVARVAEASGSCSNLSASRLCLPKSRPGVPSTRNSLLSRITVVHVIRVLIL